MICADLIVRVLFETSPVTEPDIVVVGPEGGNNPNQDKVIENLVLPSIICWMQKGTGDVVYNTAKRGVLQEEIIFAADTRPMAGPSSSSGC